MLAKPQVKLDSSRRGGLQRDDVEMKQILSARAARRLDGQHRISGEKRRENYDVAEQEDPKTIADDDALGFGAMRDSVIRGGPHGGRSAAQGGFEIAHELNPGCPASRAIRNCRSMRSTSAAVMTSSTRSRQANTTKVT